MFTDSEDTVLCDGTIVIDATEQDAINVNLELVNCGFAPLLVTSASVTGSVYHITTSPVNLLINPNEFGYYPLSPNKLIVSFPAPHVIGIYDEDLVINSNDPTGPCVIHLHGIVHAFVPGDMTAEYRSNILSMIGIPEFANPSSPPQYYLRQEWSGIADLRHYVWGQCNPGGGEERLPMVWTHSGAYEKNAAGVVIEDTGSYHVVNGNPPGPFTRSPGEGPAGYYVVDVKSPTVWSLTGDCGVYCPDPSAPSCGTLTPTAMSTLSNPDTEANAIARYHATSPAWSAPGGCGGAFLPCETYFENRTGQTFNYKESRVTITKTGLNPNTLYNLSVDLYRAPWGTSSYSLFQRMPLTATTDGSGNLDTGPIIVPNIIGYITYATNPLIQI